MNTPRPPKRLTFVTGKGGVGKTSLALSLCRHYQKQGLKVRYNCFDQHPEHEICRRLEIDYLELDNNKSAEAYIAKKLGSETLAKWVMKTPFFNSLFNMLPSFGMLIVLGHIIDQLQRDPDLHLVVDSPSSGHALTMLEATHNFQEIFGQGKLVEDIHKMHNFLYDIEKVQMLVVCLPTEMALQEGSELKKSIQSLDFKNIDLYLNDVYQLNEQLTRHENELPDFLRLKLAGEKQVREKFAGQIYQSIPHFNDQKLEEFITSLTQHLSHPEVSRI